LFLATVAALLIIALNIWLVGENIVWLFYYSKATLAIGVLLMPVVVGLLALLGYVAFKGTYEYLWKRYHGTAVELSDLEPDK
jgi:hypothetical protein